MKIVRIAKSYRLIASLLILVFVISPIPVHAWQYGVYMTPTTSTWDGDEMPTSAMTYSTAPSGVAIPYWVGSPNANEGFGQNGIEYNGLSSPLGMPNGSHSIPANSWGIWWTYCSTCTTGGGNYYGDVVPT